MFEKIYNMKKNKKGFTLVELIVVLVILAILLAILVPALTQWINKAREKQVLINARTVYLACQTVGSEYYGKAVSDVTPVGGKMAGDGPSWTVGLKIGSDDITSAKAEAVKDLADISLKYEFGCTYNADGEVAAFYFNDLSSTGSTSKFVCKAEADGELNVSKTNTSNISVAYT